MSPAKREIACEEPDCAAKSRKHGLRCKAARIPCPPFLLSLPHYDPRMFACSSQMQNLKAELGEHVCVSLSLLASLLTSSAFLAAPPLCCPAKA
jgi:hypothetical protein